MNNWVEKKRVPRRVLHFSDGVIEEFSTDEEAEREEEQGGRDGGREGKRENSALDQSFQNGGQENRSSTIANYLGPSA